MFEWIFSEEALSSSSRHDFLFLSSFPHSPRSQLLCNFKYRFFDSQVSSLKEASQRRRAKKTLFKLADEKGALNKHFLAPLLGELGEKAFEWILHNQIVHWSTMKAFITNAISTKWLKIIKELFGCRLICEVDCKNASVKDFTGKICMNNSTWFSVKYVKIYLMFFLWLKANLQKLSI